MRLSVLLPLLVLAACGAPSSPPQPAAAPAPSSSASSAHAVAPPDDALPALRTGAIPPVDVPGVLQLTVVARHAAHGYESIAATLPDDVPAMDATVAADVAAGGPVPMAFMARPAPALAPQGHGGPWVWIRRPVSTDDVTGDLYASPVQDKPGKHYRFHIASPGSHKSDVKALGAYLRGLAQQFPNRGGDDPWSPSASARLDRIADALDAPPQERRKGSHGPRPVVVHPVVHRALPPNTEVAGFLETTTGMTAVQEALQHDRPLRSNAPGRDKTVPLTAVTRPAIKHHPWSAMLSRLGAATPPPEPLAADVPAEFCYARAANLGALLSLLDELDAWVTAAGEVLRESAEDRDLSGRYETQLGLRRGPLTRALGPSVVGEVAVVASDPYLDYGSDLTLVFRLKQGALFDAALAGIAADLEHEHGTLARDTRDHGGVSVQGARTADGAVHQQRATVGDLAIVSNSPAAMDAVLDAIAGKRARLSDEPDFRYMLARDAGEHADVLTFLGDRFVGEVAGPRQKILEQRRETAQAEMQELGAAALLYGLIQGKAPSKVGDLVAAGLLAPEELTHRDGNAITWTPGGAPSSVWGTPASMTPLLDMPALERVTEAEKNAYEGFATGYQSDWAAYLDPVSVRFNVGAPDASGAHTWSASLRELPLIRRSEYRDILDFVGTSRMKVEPWHDGVRLVGAIARDSELRGELSRDVAEFSAKKLGLDWIGDWAMVGLADRSQIVTVLLKLFGDKLPQKPGGDDSNDDDLSQLATLPLYGEIAVKSPAQAALVLAAARVLADKTIPGMFDWGESETYRGISVVKVALKGDAARDLTKAGELDVFYAVAGGALIVAMQSWVMEQLIDERLDGHGVDSVGKGDGGGTQLAFDLASAPGKGLWTALAWETESELISKAGNGSQPLAEALLRGAPEKAGDPAAVRALGLAYFGQSPLTPDGSPYSLARDGVKDPVRGTDHAPSWPDVPVAGSPLEKVLRALASVHTTVGFDDEGKDGDEKLRSLHATGELVIRP